MWASSWYHIITLQGPNCIFLVVPDSSKPENYHVPKGNNKCGITFHTDKYRWKFAIRGNFK